MITRTDMPFLRGADDLTDLSVAVQQSSSHVSVLVGASMVVLLLVLWNRNLRNHRRTLKLARDAAQRAQKQAEKSANDLGTLKKDLEHLVEQRTEELIQTRQRFYQAQKMEALGALAGGIAHDFNNFLAAMMGTIELMQDEKIDDELREALDLAYDMGLRGADMIAQLLAFA